MTEELWCGDCQTFHSENYFSGMNNSQARGRKFTQPRCKKAQAIRHGKWRAEKNKKQLQLAGQMFLELTEI